MAVVQTRPASNGMATQLRQPLIATLPELRKEVGKALGYTNLLSVPNITKVIVAVGIGKNKDPKWKDLVIDRVTKIAGQKPVLKGAKKSIATFKVRQGDPSGVVVTLRGKRMLQFLEKFLHVALARMRDFRGISIGAVDNMGNITIGIREHTIFPETADEEIKNVFGLAITIGTTATNKKDAEALFRKIGVPFKK